MIQRCIEDFAHHNIDIACAILETCGRFLLRLPETKVRTQNTLDTLIRVKNNRNLDPQTESLIEDTYYCCIPPPDKTKEERQKKSLARGPLKEYIRHLLYQELTNQTANLVAKQLRKLDWG